MTTRTTSWGLPARAIDTTSNRIIHKGAANTNADGVLTLNTDNARELSMDYNASLDARSRYSSAVHEPASSIVKAVYEDALKQPPPKGHDPVVVIMGGGTGAGKTTAVTNIPGVANALKHVQMIYDTNLADFESSVKKTDQALAAGKDVDILYVHRDPIESMFNEKGGVLQRAEEKGRTVSISQHVNAHEGATQTVPRLMEHYRGNPRVKFTFIDNRLGKDQAHLATVDILRENLYPDLEAQLHQEVEELFRTGELSERVYHGTKGFDQGFDGATARPAGGDVSGYSRPEQAAGPADRPVARPPR